MRTDTYTTHQYLEDLRLNGTPAVSKAVEELYKKIALLENAYLKTAKTRAGANSMQVGARVQILVDHYLSRLPSEIRNTYWSLSLGRHFTDRVFRHGRAGLTHEAESSGNAMLYPVTMKRGNVRYLKTFGKITVNQRQRVMSAQKAAARLNKLEVDRKCRKVTAAENAQTQVVATAAKVTRAVKATKTKATRTNTATVTRTSKASS